jgi:hypothetical protein
MSTSGFICVATTTILVWLVGCGGPIFTIGDTLDAAMLLDSGAQLARVESQGGDSSVVVDSGSPDTSVTSAADVPDLSDSGSVLDSTIDAAVIADSAIVSDTNIVDALVFDTNVLDTNALDTFVSDTFTFVPDAFVSDTFVPDTSVLDTDTLVDSAPPPDTATPTVDSSVVDSSNTLMCSTPTTPMLTGVQGHFGGIQFHVTVDTVLTAFTFTGALAAPDTATLTDDNCVTIANASMPNEPLPGYMPYAIQVHWPLMAGVSYRLMSTTSQTAYTTSEGSAPFVSGVMVVEAGLVSCPGGIIDASGIWTGFTDLTFCMQ